MKFMPANRIAPDGTLRFAGSHLGLSCLPMSHKKDVRLIWVKVLHTRTYSVIAIIKASACSQILNFIIVVLQIRKETVNSF